MRRILSSSNEHTIIIVVVVEQILVRFGGGSVPMVVAVDGLNLAHIRVTLQRFTLVHFAIKEIVLDALFGIVPLDNMSVLRTLIRFVRRYVVDERFLHVTTAIE